MTVTYTLLASDFVAVQWVYRRRKFFGRIAVWSIPTFALTMTAVTVWTIYFGTSTQQNQAAANLAPFVSICVIYCVVYFGLPYFAALQSFKVNPNTKAPVT